MFQVSSPQLPAFMRCAVCGCCDSDAFVLDYAHGSTICTKCGAELQSYQMLLPTFADMESHRNGALSAIQTTSTPTPTSTTTTIASASAAPAAVVRKPKLIEVRQAIELLVDVFELQQNTCIVSASMAIYERKLDIYASGYLLKPSIWAAAVFFLYNSEHKLLFTYREMASALNVEPKKISKAVRVIRTHDPLFRIEQQKHVPQNIYSVARLSRLLGLVYKYEMMVKTLVEFIDTNELISGLNPLSILSVSFFFVMILKRTTADVKRTLNTISKHLLIAVSTIKKGTKEVKHKVLDFIGLQGWFAPSKIASLQNLI